MADQGMSPACDVCGRQRGEVGARVECAVCHRTKKPRGRDAPMEAANGYCSEDCSGYRADPQVGDLWPGELRWVFGHGIMGNEAERCHAKSGEESDAAECYRLGYERMRRERNETLVNAGSIGAELLAKLDRAELALECAKGAHFKAQLEHEERAAALAALAAARDNALLREETAFHFAKRLLGNGPNLMEIIRRAAKSAAAAQGALRGEATALHGIASMVWGRNYASLDGVSREIDKIADRLAALAAESGNKRHRCMRCRVEFECRTAGCRAQYDVLPSIVQRAPDGSVQVVEHECGKTAPPAAESGKHGAPAVVMVPSLAVDDAADARIADLRTRQLPEGPPAPLGGRTHALAYRCSVCGSGRIRTDDGEFGACSFLDCPNPMADYVREHPALRGPK
jgi:hypothetical protein